MRSHAVTKMTGGCGPPPFATIKPDAPTLDAAHLLIETNQRGLPVSDHNGAVVGVISEGDFLHRTELDLSPPPGNWLEELRGIEEDTPARRRMRARLSVR